MHEQDPIHADERFDPSPRARTPRNGAIAALVIAVIVGLAGAYWYWQDTQEEMAAAPAPALESAPPMLEDTPSDATATVTASPAPTTAPIDAPPSVTLPDLHESDAFVRERVADWQIPYVLIEESDLIARLAVVVTNSADGTVPTRLLKSIAPSGRFTVVEAGEQIYLDPTSYERYNAYLTVLETIPPEDAARLLNLLDPLINEALTELGEQRSATALIRSAFQRIKALPELPGNIELVQEKVLYQYADPNLEGLPDFEKQILRFGPANIAKLQTWIAAFEKTYDD